MTRRQVVGFAWAAGILILVLAFSQTRSGTIQTIGFVVALPVILVLFVIAVRAVRAGRPRAR
jgi:uncharacterized integral membrane protein